VFYREDELKLRDHPLMCYRGVCNWPPVWTWVDGKENEHPHGEIGTLIDVRQDFREPGRLFLVMHYKGGGYMGCLLFDDRIFCRQLYDLLKNFRRHSISYIGDLDISETL
jgi:hypothetical protein